MKNSNVIKSILIWTFIFLGFAVISKQQNKNYKFIVAFAVIYFCVRFGILFYNNLRKRATFIPTKKYDMMDLKDVRTLESILKTNKLAYQFDEDKDAMNAFMIYTFLGGKNVHISNDMARLFEKQLRLEDFYLDIKADTDLGKAMRTNQKSYSFVPFIDVQESLQYDKLVFDMNKLSVKVPKTKLDEGIKDFDLIACKVNEYYHGDQFTRNDILVIEQGKYVNEIITYKLDDKEISIYGRILFALSEAQYLSLNEEESTVKNLDPI